jgi:cell division protein FtsB
LQADSWFNQNFKNFNYQSLRNLDTKNPLVQDLINQFVVIAKINNKTRILRKIDELEQKIDNLTSLIDQEEERIAELKLSNKEYNDKIAAGTLDDYIRETIKRYDNNISKNGTLVYNLKGEDDTEYVDISKHRPLSIGK